jgi:hypothetical protein
MKAREKSLLVTILWLMFSGICFGYPEPYGPFEKNEKPKLFKIHSCKEVRPKDPNSWYEGQEAMVAYSESGREVHIRYHPKENHVTAALLDINEKVICGPVVILSLCSPMSNVYQADLNGDNKEDFIILTSTMGCGLAAHGCMSTFVLSSYKDYKITPVYSMSPGPEDFVTLDDDGKCCFVHTSFVYGEKGRDGKVHNYWVYNLLRFWGNKVILDNSVDGRFPKWIWYTFKPNNKATTQLNEEQKKRLWEEQKERYFSAIKVNSVNPDAGIVEQEISGKGCLKDEVIWGDYVLRTYRGEYEGLIEIDFRGRVAYQQKGHAFYISGKELLKKEQVVPMGLDLTGDGKQNFLFYEWSGGAHCCFNATILTTEIPIKQVAIIEGRHTVPVFEDLDDDGLYEVIVRDWTYDYWPQSFAGSPAPEVILVYNGSEYVPSKLFMFREAPSEKELKEKVTEVKNELTTTYDIYKGLPFQYALNLMYTGHEELGWQFIEQVWPESESKEKEELIESLRGLMEHSSYWQKLKTYK